MTIERMRGLLEDAMDRLARISLEEFLSRPVEQYFEEHGAAFAEGSDHCQIAVERLDRHREHDVEVATISVTASDGRRTLGAMVSVFADGTPSVKSEIVEFRDGVASPLT